MARLGPRRRVQGRVDGEPSGVLALEAHMPPATDQQELLFARAAKRSRSPDRRGVASSSVRSPLRSRIARDRCFPVAIQRPSTSSTSSERWTNTLNAISCFSSRSVASRRSSRRSVMAYRRPSSSRSDGRGPSDITGAQRCFSAAAGPLPRSTAPSSSICTMTGRCCWMPRCAHSSKPSRV